MSTKQPGLLPVKSFFLLLPWIFIVLSCNKKVKLVSINPEISKYISSYTSGVISKNAAIRIRMAANAKTTHEVGQVDKNLFEFYPQVKGKTTWVDAMTVEFKPDKPMKPGQLYMVSFQLGKVMDVPDEFREFVFNAEILRPSFVFREHGLRSSGDKESMFLPGTIETADMEDSTTIERLLTARHGKDDLKVSWEHPVGSRMHHYKIEGIKKQSVDDSLQLSWDGMPLDSKNKGRKMILVPAAGHFTVLDVRAINDDGQYVSVLFSDPIKSTQELTGLIVVGNQEQPTYSIDGSEVKVYLPETPEGDYIINVNPGIENSFDQKLAKGFTSNVSFATKKPSVTITGKGNILPHEGKLTLPFTAINLNAVDISIIRIYENNIPQFLQDNNMDDRYRLRQVAIPIAQQTVRLDDDKSLDLHRQQRFSIDIDKYVKVEPGSIYNITIGFRPDYSLYDCGGQTMGFDENRSASRSYYHDNSPDDHADFWDRYDDYYPFGYDWEHRENPCYSAYYNKDQFASRNIFASNIGIIARRGSNNQLSVVVTDMITAQPLPGAAIKILDYQSQIIGTAKSDKNGFATPPLTGKPYLIIVSSDAERGYLKVDDGSNLPLSRFDIAGQEVQKGIKGFIFGERGVWRPGDSLYISFIEQSRDANLPPDHPIEFELYNPLGQLYKKIIQKNETGGYNVFRTATDAEAITGNWRARAKAGGAIFEKTIRIETVMPNRLKIDVSFGNDTLLGKNRTNAGTIASSWLFGAPAKNMKATIDLSLSKGTGSMASFKHFVFENPLAKNETKTVQIFNGNLNESGNAKFSAGIHTDENTGGIMRANMLIKVFEPGGAFSIKSFSLPYSPFASYVGIQVPKGKNTWDFLPTGTTHTAKIVDVDPTGKLMAGKRQLEVSLYKIQWRWWWDRSGDNFSNFTQNRYNKLIKNETIHIENGKADWNFSVPQNDWGRYLILIRDVASGHTTGDVVYLDDPGWQSRSNFDDPTAASMLSFTSDKDTYQAGEKITLIIPGSSEGRGLIMISSGSRLIKSWWIDTKAGQTQVSFNAEKDWAPNIYASVSLLQPYEQTANDLPIRMYGVIPIKIENPETILTPLIDIADIIRPEQKTTITVREKNNRAMWYSIAIVDDGLLDLTNFKTPNPYDYFYAKEALSVKSWDMYDLVIGAWGNNLERILTIGGDQGANGSLQPKGANRFPPVVKFMGPFRLDKGKQTHSFTLPQYSGSIRVMVIAAGDNASGNAQKTVLVKKPLMMLATLPRVLSPGEEIKLPVTIFATEKNIHTVDVRLETNPLLETISPSTQQVRFSQPGDETIYFNARVRDQTGIVKVQLTAASGGEKAGYQTELNIRNANPPITRVQSATIHAHGSSTQTIQPIGKDASGETVVEISSLPDMSLQKHLDFLIDYPHGCAEQITSRAFAQLYLNRLTELNPDQKAKIEKNIRAGIASLQNFQTTDGGYAYWPGSRESDDWGSSYAGHFLLLAKDAGYYVPDQMLDQWKSFQQSRANNWAPSTRQFYGADLAQAYRLYTLALAKTPALGAMNRLKAFQYISPEAKWRLAAAYQLGGYAEVANTLISGLSADFAKRSTPGFTYGSNLRDEAMVLETLTLMGKQSRAEDLLFKITAQLSQNTWYSTQTTAYALLAIQEFAGKNKNDQKITAIVNRNGRDTVIATQHLLTRIPLKYRNGTNSVTIRNQGRNTLFVNTITKGQPLTGEVIPPSNNAQLLRMQVSYMTADKKPIDVSNLAQGSNFIAKVSVTNPGNRGDYSRMALTQIVPSGWEILNTRLFNAAGEFTSSPMQHQDIRDDRVYTYFDLAPGATKTFYLQITAAYTGRYFMPSVYCSFMYDESIQASTEGKWIRVKPVAESAGK